MISPSNPSSSPFESGQLINGRYELRRDLGSGSVGSVYLAYDERENRQVALKLIRPRIEAEAITRLQNEFVALATLRHPQIAQVYDFGYTDEILPFYT